MSNLSVMMMVGNEGGNSEAVADGTSQLRLMDRAAGGNDCGGERGEMEEMGERAQA